MVTLNEILLEKHNANSKLGTYSGVKASKETQEKIAQYLKDNKIPTPIKPESVHVTLLYSKKYLPNYEPHGKLDTPYVCTSKNFTVWKTSPTDPNEEKTNCLVVKLNCPELIKRHKDLMKEHGATYSHDNYTPHVTFSYDIGDLDVSKLPKIDFELIFDEEYKENLDLNWAKTKGTK